MSDLSKITIKVLLQNHRKSLTIFFESVGTTYSIDFLTMSDVAHTYCTSSHDYYEIFVGRYNIAIQAAHGLCYLHHDCSPLIVHRDVKSNNILLDSTFHARVADFGLAKLFQDTGISESMSSIAGSYGYIAPGKFPAPTHILMLFIRPSHLKFDCAIGKSGA